MKYLLAVLLLIPTMAYAESYYTDTERIKIDVTPKSEALASWIADRDNSCSVASAWHGKCNEAISEIAKLEDVKTVTVQEVTADIEAKAAARNPVIEQPEIDEVIYPEADQFIYN